MKKVKSFVCVHSVAIVRGQSNLYSGVPTKKCDLMVKMVEMRSFPIKNCIMKTHPVEPSMN